MRIRHMAWRRSSAVTRSSWLRATFRAARSFWLSGSAVAFKSNLMSAISSSDLASEAGPSSESLLPHPTELPRSPFEPRPRNPPDALSASDAALRELNHEFVMRLPDERRMPGIRVILRFFFG